MHIRNLSILIIFLIIGCNEIQLPKNQQKTYARWVGDISANPNIDSENFRICNDENQIYQYFNDSNGLQYEGEKKSIINLFQNEYDVYKKGEDGYLRIRFIINCNGQAGRYRILGMDNKYKEKKFDKSISKKLLSITKLLTDWQPKYINGQGVDYYQYLTFKLKNGEIIEILP